ncbi:MAG TPA: hypothetical protein VFA09_07650, partial [Ktedonobacteraceae bacterium]|nr:hypothetical protein [Ktedonobacteraceae bacterium]
MPATIRKAGSLESEDSSMARHLSSIHPVHLHLVRHVSASRRGRRSALRQLVLSCLLTLLVLAGVLSQWSLLIKPASAAASVPVRSTPPSLTFAKYLKQGPHSTPPHSGPPSPYPQPPKHSRPGQPFTPSSSAEPATMSPINQVLSPAFLHGAKGTTALDLHGSDGRLELILQPGSLDLSHASIPGGKAPHGSLTLQLRQAYGHFESMLNLLGSYSAQIVDSTGHVVSGITLTTPATLLYHYQPGEFEALNLDAASILLSWPGLIAAARQAHQSTAELTILMHNDSQTRRLSAQSTVLGPGPFSLGGDPQNQMAPIPHEAEVQGNNGQLSYSYPLQVAPGSGGFAPQLTLTYSSIGPNDRHNATSPADDAGDGWALGLGSITADVYPNGTTWYFLNGIDNVGDRMLLYDSTNKLYYTEHLSYLRIQQVSANGQPCFDVWDKSGTFYELGCTPDSLEYSINNGQRDNYAWNVDRIVAPNEGPNSIYKMIQVSYLQDCSGSAPPCGASTTVRDAVIKQITYGISTDLKTITYGNMAGTIDFTYRAQFDDAPWATHYGTNYNCNGTPPKNTTVRCDDPVQYTGSNPFTPPTVMGTFSLTGITSYLNTDGSSSNAAYAYNFSYTDTPFQFCTDPVSLENGYCAGEHVLTAIQPVVFQSGTPHPLQSITFSYSPAPGQSGVLTNTYYDPSNLNHNNQPISSSTSWQYLTAYQDLDTGIGEQISYAPAYNNSDGTPTYIVNGQVKDDRYDALYCYNNRNNQSQYQCTGHYAHPDDRAWSTQVVTQITSSGQDSSALAPATTQFNYYRLAYTNAQWDQHGPLCYQDQYGQEKDCVGDNWLSSLNEGGEDWGDYFHAEFRGFAQVWQLSPSQDLSIGYYFSTAGWNSSMTDPNNYNAGQPQRYEVYQQATYQSSSLLSQTINTYPTTSNACVSGPPSSWNPYDACTIALLSSVTTEFDGNSTSNAPWIEHDYTYDDYNNGLNTNNTYHNLTQEVIKGSNLPSAPPTQLYPLTETWSYTVNNNNGQGGWTYYTVDTVTHSEVDDAAGNKWLCQSTTYDEHPGTNNPTPAAGRTILARRLGALPPTTTR